MKNKVSRLIRDGGVPVLTAAALALACNAPTHAEIVFQAGFDGAAASGGAGIVQVGGEGALAGGPGAVTTVETSTPFVQGSGGYMSIGLDHPTSADGSPTYAGANFTPETPQNWMNSWYTDNGDQDVMNGAFDFFVRASEDITTTQRTIRMESDYVAHGYRLVIENTGSNSIGLTVFGKPGAGGTTVISSNNYGREPDGFMTPGSFYHIAFVAEEVGAGLTEFKLYIAEGDTAIDPSVDTPIVTTGAVQLDPTDDISGSFELGSGFLGVDPLTPINAGGGAYENLDATYEVDMFRIYDEVPDSFSSLSATVPEPGSFALAMLSCGACVLARTRSRSR